MEAAIGGQLDGRSIQRDLVVVGASAGAVDALQRLVAGLPPEFPAAVLVVLHVPATGTSVLPQILTRKGPLPAAFACDGDQLERGQIYIAPADHHMLVHAGQIRLSQGPRENGHRPAIDPLFRSAARSGGGRCIGVILSGLLDDGATGLRFIKERGGGALVQADAPFPSMPSAAMAVTSVDRTATAPGLPAALCEMVDRLGAVAPGVPSESDELDRVELEDPSDPRMLLEGPPTALTCPECGGALWEQVEAGVVRFACHVGHVYSLAALAEEQGRGLERTLWSAVCALEERADVHRRIARRTSERPAGPYHARAAEAESQARRLREILGGTGRLAAPAPEGA